MSVEVALVVASSWAFICLMACIFVGPFEDDIEIPDYVHEMFRTDDVS